jgi:hypothetical protein
MKMLETKNAGLRLYNAIRNLDSKFDTSSIPFDYSPAQLKRKPWKIEVGVSAKINWDTQPDGTEELCHRKVFQDKLDTAAFEIEQSLQKLWEALYSDLMGE